MTSPFVPIAAPIIGTAEEEAVVRVLRSGRLAEGPEVEAFEEEFAAASGVEHAVAVANGTLALVASLLGIGVEPGDEVLVPGFSFAASAGAVVAVGARPVFVDIGHDYCIDPADAEAKLTSRTAAIMPVHLYGLLADMKAVSDLARRHGLAIVEDAAQAHLARRGEALAGATGVGAFSLYATKNMMSGEGGVVTSDDAEVAQRVRLIRNHGMPNRYQHDIYGLNFRMMDLQAALARVQLTRLPDGNQHRRSLAAHYDQALPPVMERSVVPPGAHHVYHQYTVRVPASQRDATVHRLRDRGIGAEVYYPTTIPAQPAYAKYQPDGGLPVAETAAASVLSLPVHPGVDESARDRVVRASVAAIERPVS